MASEVFALQQDHQRMQIRTAGKLNIRLTGFSSPDSRSIVLVSADCAAVVPLMVGDSGVGNESSAIMLQSQHKVFEREHDIAIELGQRYRGLELDK